MAKRIQRRSLKPENVNGRTGGKAVSEERFEHYGSLYVNCPGVEADEPLGSKFFHNHLYSVLLPISCKTFPLNDI